jgi:hypothetical protein
MDDPSSASKHNKPKVLPTSPNCSSPSDLHPVPASGRRRKSHRYETPANIDAFGSVSLPRMWGDETCD